MIKFIYFDVGGVMIKDFSGTNKWQELKNSIGVKSSFEIEFDEFFTKYEIEACAGRDIETLITIMEDRFGLSLPAGYSFLADFVNRFEKNESIWPIVHKLQEKYRIGLLTNMYPNMLDKIHEASLMPYIDWEVVIDSSVDKVQKPQLEIFKLAEARAGVGGGEILFVENTKRHIEAAKKFGWQTLLYDPTDTSQSNVALVSQCF